MSVKCHCDFIIILNLLKKESVKCKKEHTAQLSSISGSFLANFTKLLNDCKVTFHLLRQKPALNIIFYSAFSLQK